ncbi:reverse transcriptase, partial [Tanacetum coccineum]
MKVRIWEDYWLEGFRTLDYRPQNYEYNVISDLLDARTGEWNHSLLLQLFPQHIATKIACTHINTFEHDLLYWDASSNRVFTCKSAYWIATEIIECFQEPLLTHERKSLKYIWLANIPGLAPGSLNCIHCSAIMEDTKHALFLCNWTRDVWSNMNLTDITDHVADISIEEVLTTAKDRGQGTLELMLMVMWRIWCVRNCKAHGGEEIEPNKIKESACAMLQDFYRANADSEAHIGTLNAPSNVLWSPPSNGVIKINADGGISSRNGVAGIGFVMRGHNGSVVVAGNRRIAYASSVIETEAKAILWAIQVVLSKGFSNVILETDSSSQSFVGVNYGQVADNLPPPEATAKLLQTTSIGKVRMYGADPAIIRALANTGIGIVIGAANGDIPALASDPNYATQWVNSNVLAYPDSKILVVTVGNEVMNAVDQTLVSLCLPAMQNVQNALNA